MVMDRTGQNSIPEPITKVETWLYTPTKTTSKSDKIEEESQQRKHPEQKKQFAEVRQAGTKTKRSIKETQDNGLKIQNDKPTAHEEPTLNTENQPQKNHPNQ